MEIAREGVNVLLNDVWHSTVIDFGCVSSRIIFIKSMFSVCVAVGYDSSEGDGEERERFWNELDRVVDRVGIGYRI